MTRLGKWSWGSSFLSSSKAAKAGGPIQVPHETHLPAMPSWEDFQRSPHYPLVVSHDPQAKGQVGGATQLLICPSSSLQASHLAACSCQGLCGANHKGAHVSPSYGEPPDGLAVAAMHATVPLMQLPAAAQDQTPSLPHSAL
jgi:hypothetical protein